MRGFWLSALGYGAVGLVASSGASVAAPRDPSGVWLVQDGRARIAVDKCGPTRENLCGYVVWLKSPVTDSGEPRRDLKNPDARKRMRPALGHQLIMGLKSNAEDHYEGNIYNSEDGNSYNVTIWLDAPEQLKVKGCLIAFLCSTQTWTHVADVAPGQLTGAPGTANGPTPDPEWASARPTAAAAPARPAARPAPKP